MAAAAEKAMKKVTNQCMLITYSDSMGKDLMELYAIFKEEIAGVIEGGHILPPLPSSGARGLAPIIYEHVDAGFGDLEDI